ncbi:MAG: ribosomal protein S18-alanine N-acetyltransferase [Terracidiphilus sp.]
MNVQANDVQIRRMTPADVPRVMAIASSLPEAPRWPVSAYLDALNPESPARRIALVAAASEQVQGFVVASLLPPQAELETIAVASQNQRQGLGRLLFDALSLELHKEGVAEVVLEVRASNRAAMAFYRSAGFGQKGIRRSYYVDPVEDAVVMGLRLI